MSEQTPYVTHDQGLSVIVPCFRSQGTLRRLVSDFQKAELAHRYEILLVNDACDQRSGVLISELAAEHKEVRGLFGVTNQGQHLATLAGTKAARFNKCLTLDADLEVSVSEALRLLGEPLLRGEVRYGTRDDDPRGLGRRFASAVAQFIYRNFTDMNFTNVSSCRLFETALVDGIESHPGIYFNLDVALSERTSISTTMRLAYQRRLEGRSSYGAIRLIRHALLMVVSSRLGIRRILTFLSLLFLSVLAFLCAWMVVLLWAGQTPPGYLSITVFLIVFSSIQVALLGTIVRLQLLRAPMPLWHELQKPPFDDGVV